MMKAAGTASRLRLSWRKSWTKPKIMGRVPTLAVLMAEGDRSSVSPRHGSLG
jgi:hypothetical protein